MSGPTKADQERQAYYAHLKALITTRLVDADEPLSPQDVPLHVTGQWVKRYDDDLDFDTWMT